ncbi:hypothetical protein ARMSODRAFT_1038390 [Armillaria solidipes]|uniref:Uncharacterized protein n=1 Tax=Armillaria solidipes TaxID=1076256 RepID=A0A2H3AKD0_9AGAR|nr:hypothetical protein ARMSODRAFT_1038390 [Armillaria solidipes]
MMGTTRRASDPFAAVTDMQKRVSTNPEDKIAGLAFLMGSKTVPEDAWTALINAMHPVVRARFLLLYPRKGLGCKKWRPTWEQVMNAPLPADDIAFEFVDHDDDADEDRFGGPYIKTGLDRQKGVIGVELVVEDADGMAHTIQILATHQFPIPEGAYTLLANIDRRDEEETEYKYWIVGQSLPDQRFEKLSVFQISDLRERNRLDQLGIVQLGQFCLL